MDGWQAVQNWLIFAVIVGGATSYYYATKKDTRQHRGREQGPASTAIKKKRSDLGTRQKSKGLTDATTTEPAAQSVADSASDEALHIAKANPRKRKVHTKHLEEVEPAPALVVQGENLDDGLETSTRQFAQQMVQARQGQKVGGPKSKEQRIKTVKQSGAVATPVTSSGTSDAGVDGDDDMSPAQSPAVRAGDVSDMLQPSATGPSTLRLTAPANPPKARPIRQLQPEVVETKKQRQNRQRAEERKLLREEAEKQRKVLEEKQRRTAREARGEPAKNGIPIAKPPANNPWSAPIVPLAPTVHGNHSGPLLDTFDAESTGSSNGLLEPSTAATSTSEAGPTQRDHDMLSEENQVAIAMKQSEDESGWTTVAAPKKQKKKAANGETDSPITAEPTMNVDKVSTSTTKPAVNGKPNGYHALRVDDDSRSNSDVNDASSWDA